MQISSLFWQSYWIFGPWYVQSCNLRMLTILICWLCQFDPTAQSYSLWFDQLAYFIRRCSQLVTIGVMLSFFSWIHWYSPTGNSYKIVAPVIFISTKFDNLDGRCTAKSLTNFAWRRCYVFRFLNCMVYRCEAKGRNWNLLQSDFLQIGYGTKNGKFLISAGKKSYTLTIKTCFFPIFLNSFLESHISEYPLFLTSSIFYSYLCSWGLICSQVEWSRKECYI